MNLFGDLCSQSLVKPTFQWELIGKTVVSILGGAIEHYTWLEKQEYHEDYDPGKVKTDLSRQFWSGVPEKKSFEPAYAVERLVEIVEGLEEERRGRIWDWAGKEVLP